MMHTKVRLAVAIAFIFTLAGCGQQSAIELTEIATSEALWTGVAVSQEGRMFVNYPRWFPSVDVSVAEITSSGAVRPYPDETWNRWSPESSATDHFVCVQSVYVDGDDFLWILDPAPVWLTGPVPWGPKLLKVDLDLDSVVQTFYFDTTVAPRGSYLNDVRVDTERGFAYISESGLGGIVVVDLASSQSRRLLADHPSTRAEDIVLVIGGREYLNPDGSKPQIHSDGIALDAGGEYLYYQALTGHNL
ncbi:MAG: hypothetical protein JSW54_03255, partial [Fidelibacterota bacterium]